MLRFRFFCSEKNSSVFKSQTWHECSHFYHLFVQWRSATQQRQLRYLSLSKNPIQSLINVHSCLHLLLYYISCIAIIKKSHSQMLQTDIYGHIYMEKLLYISGYQNLAIRCILTTLIMVGTTRISETSKISSINFCF